ncbi:inactive receptor kinase [Musa troglodytarum]|uniref:Inactive receptor kinase n=1 Tax=Musa troglodytarum TaxID=320322 RepID=A0A9E7FRA3_9LILI|nr:inactive receptor kinase [Musa troglodytarum]
MHSAHHHYHLPLLLLLTFGRVVAADSQLKTLLVAIFLIVDALVLLILLWTIYAFCRRLKAKETGTENPPPAVEAIEKGEGMRCDEEEDAVVQEPGKITFAKDGGGFGLEDLLKASAEGLGKGSFGSCYKATLDGARMVVVKRLRGVGPVTEEEFLKHMKSLSAMEHPNLMPLLGYYFSTTEKLVISNYACRGNLFDRIHGRRRADRTPFTWSSRLQVAQGVAQGMEFLHLNMRSSVPHGNLKASNVLLDENDKPLVCDHGLVPLIPASLAVHRMVCYKSPEYQHNRSVSRKTDVWSYGCLLLELITGRVAANTTPGGVRGGELCHWVNRAVREEWTGEVFDAEMLVQKRATSGMIMLLKLALWCCEQSPEKRPEMAEVAGEVERITAGEADEEDD